MERSEHGRMDKRPEFEQDKPAQLFDHAKKMEAWYREKVNETILPDDIEILSEQLNNYIDSRFEVPPEVTVVSTDITHTSSVTPNPEHQGVYEITSGPMPYELVEQHDIKGILYGFHRGVKNDLRVFIKDKEQIVTEGGIYIPLLSVSVQSSEIKFTAFTAAEQLQALGAYITEHINKYGPEASAQVSTLLKGITKDGETALHKLQFNSYIMNEIDSNPLVPQQFVDTLLEYVRLKLKLTMPHDIQTFSHRVAKKGRYVNSYNLEPGALLESVVPELGFIVESGQKSLGLFFLHNERAIEISVQKIGSMHRSEYGI